MKIWMNCHSSNGNCFCLSAIFLELRSIRARKKTTLLSGCDLSDSILKLSADARDANWIQKCRVF